MHASKSLAFVCLVIGTVATCGISYGQATKQVEKVAPESTFASSSALSYKPPGRTDKTIWDSRDWEAAIASNLESDLAVAWTDDKKPTSPTELKKTKIILPSPPAKPKTPPIKWDWKSTTMIALLQQ